MSELGTWSDCPGPLPLRPGWGFWLSGLSRVLARTGLYEGDPEARVEAHPKGSSGGLVRICPGVSACSCLPSGDVSGIYLMHNRKESAPHTACVPRVSPQVEHSRPHDPGGTVPAGSRGCCPLASVLPAPRGWGFLFWSGCIGI